MRKNLGVQACLYPMPVLVIGTYDEQEVANAMVATWGGISNYNQISIFLTKSHKTVKNILQRKAFTVSIADAAHVKECDYVGMVSANEVSDKLNKAGFHTMKSELVDAPMIEELSMTFECQLHSYNETTNIMIGTIVNVSVDEKVLNTEGKIDPAKLQPLTFDSFNNDYLIIGNKVGNAMHDGLAIQ